MPRLPSSANVLQPQALFWACWLCSELCWCWMNSVWCCWCFVLLGYYWLYPSLLQFADSDSCGGIYYVLVLIISIVVLCFCCCWGPVLVFCSSQHALQPLLWFNYPANHIVGLLLVFWLSAACPIISLLLFSFLYLVLSICYILWLRIRTTVIQLRSKLLPPNWMGRIISCGYNLLERTLLQGES